MESREQLIDAILAGRDAFGTMPTGGIKSRRVSLSTCSMSLPGRAEHRVLYDPPPKTHYK